MEFTFTLPVGLLDAAGQLHREGRMRRAVAADEIEPFADPRVRANTEYLPVAVLSRVVTRIGGFAPISPEVIAALYAEDFHYLQDLYVQINGHRLQDLIETACPNCGARLVLDVARPLVE